MSIRHFFIRRFVIRPCVIQRFVFRCFVIRHFVIQLFVIRRFVIRRFVAQSAQSSHPLLGRGREAVPMLKACRLSTIYKIFSCAGLNQGGAREMVSRVRYSTERYGESHQHYSVANFRSFRTGVLSLHSQTGDRSRVIPDCFLIFKIRTKNDFPPLIPAPSPRKVGGRRGGGQRPRQRTAFFWSSAY
jgi:hypothetical protein